MQPDNWPSTFIYSPVPICRDVHENLFRQYLVAKNWDPQKSSSKKVHLDLMIQKITPEFVYQGPLPHPLAGQDAFEGHAQHGIFAKKKILKGAVLGEYVGEVFLTKKGISEHVFQKNGIYCWHLLLNDLCFYMYSGRFANELTFVNDFHGLGEGPNVRGKWFVDEGFYYFGYEAIKDIDPMEEVLIDYQSKRLAKSV